MKYRRLGGTDLNVSVICLGPMRAAAGKPGSDEKSTLGEAALRHALDAGVNFIHSSYEYGTRWMLGRVLKKHPKRSELHHVIKVPAPDRQDDCRFDPKKFQMRIEQALGDLSAERIDVLQWIFRTEPNTDEIRLPRLPETIEQAAEVFERMRDEGKVGYLMSFPYTLPAARIAIDSGRLAGLVDYFNLFETTPAAFFDDLRRHGMGFLAIRPLYQGILTDARSEPAALPPGDRFAGAKSEPVWAKRRKVAEAFADEIGGSMTSFAIRFALADPVVGSVVVGLNTPAQVDGIVEAVEGTLPPADIVNRARALWHEEADQ